jgi:PIN domain
MVGGVLTPQKCESRARGHGGQATFSQRDFPCRNLQGHCQASRKQKKRTQPTGVVGFDPAPWFAGRILPVTEPSAERMGRWAGEGEIRGRTIKIADGLIAATALEHDLTLATRDVRDFAAFGVAIFNPWEE